MAREQRAAVLQPVRDPAGRGAVRLPRHAGPAAVELRGRHGGRALLLHLDADASPTPTRARRARRSSTHNPYWQQFDRTPTRGRRPRGAPRRSRSSVTRWAPRRSRRCRAPTAGWPRSSPSTSSDRASRRRPPRRHRQQARRAGAGTAVGVRLHRLAVPHERGLVARPAPSPDGPTPDARARDRVRRLAAGRRGQHARRAACLDAPRVHRHPAGAARPAATARRSPATTRSVAGPLPQAPAQRHRADRGRRSATSNPSATGVGHRSPSAGRAAELLLLLGLRLDGRQRRPRATATSPGWAASGSRSQRRRTSGCARLARRAARRSRPVARSKKTTATRARARTRLAVADLGLDR